MSELPEDQRARQMAPAARPAIGLSVAIWPTQGGRWMVTHSDGATTHHAEMDNWPAACRLAEQCADNWRRSFREARLIVPPRVTRQ